MIPVVHRHIKNIKVGGDSNHGEHGLESDAPIINGCEQVTQRSWDDRDKNVNRVKWLHVMGLNEDSGSATGGKSIDSKLV